MAFQPAPNTYQLAVLGRMPAGRPWANVFHLRADTFDPITQTLADGLSAVVNDAYTELIGFLHTEWHCDEIVLTDLRTEGAAQFRSDVGISGTDNDVPLPDYVALVVSWITGTRGRSFRGRTYLGGWVNESSGGPGPGPGTISAAQDFASSVLTNFHAGVLSRRHLKVERPTAVLTAITSSIVGPLWDTQRGRKGIETI